MEEAKGYRNGPLPKLALRQRGPPLLQRAAHTAGRKHPRTSPKAVKACLLLLLPLLLFGLLLHLLELLLLLLLLLHGKTLRREPFLVKEMQRCLLLSKTPTVSPLPYGAA